MQVVKEIHLANFELEPHEVEAILIAAVKRARKERRREAER